MLVRTLALPTLLAASVAVPYVATNGTDGLPVPWKSSSQEHSVGAADFSTLPDARRRNFSDSKQGPGALISPTDTARELIPAISVEEVLRMDVNKEWVYQRWARKSTTTSQLNLFGVRVPLVTGTQLHDVAGSLTYLFGANGHVHRLNFRGRTGDTSLLVNLVAQRYGLVRQPTAIAGEELYQLKNGNDIISELRTRPAPVLWASTPHQSYDVELTLQRPDVAQPLVRALPPLPKVNDADIRAAEAKAAAERKAAEAKQGASQNLSSKEKAEKQRDGWKAFFPRSRIPKDQADNLDSRNQLW
ncbi:DUF6690 family protein [Adhaeretor mobilis]|uniref:DUF6690 domain-containing protein n=1 Tax=Adhaeretor mobilis TaxID=1930276 RepID=A0A517MXQ3_9BACT|nr:DUF6690 family protein [Adhaeretor mobilis]QDS99651.1 hypothetical protein HG15A2_29780 [Adhaeretor mobilis]